MVLLREDQCDRKGKREEEVARNRMRSEPGVIEGRCGVGQRERVLRLAREQSSTGVVALSLSSAAMKAGGSGDVLLTTSSLYLQQAAAIVILHQTPLFVPSCVSWPGRGVLPPSRGCNTAASCLW